MCYQQRNQGKAESGEGSGPNLSPFTQRNRRNQSEMQYGPTRTQSLRRSFGRLRLFHQHSHKIVFGKEPEFLLHGLDGLGIAPRGNAKQGERLVEPVAVGMEPDGRFKGRDRLRGATRAAEKVSQGLVIGRLSPSEID